MDCRKPCAVLCACAALFYSPPAHAQRRPAAAARPRLVVILVVDQMRADYVEKFQHQWIAGLRRLLDRGAWFRQAAYPYLGTVTCAGHATIGTGTFPATHGIPLNAWWDRETGTMTDCTEDSGAKNISYGAPVNGGNSGGHLRVPTLADELRAQAGGHTRVVTMSLKPRSAIMLAGRRADSTVWFDTPRGAWVTSAAFAKEPVNFLEKFLSSQRVERDFGKSWTRALPGSAYLYEDDAAGEKAPGDWSRVFPHPIYGPSEKVDAVFYSRWQMSPFADAYLGEMAQAAVDALGLGKGPGVDFLGVSFSALDTVGHSFGPRSHEVQDVLARLDATIGKLLAHLDRAIGAENYVVAVSADHGVAPIPEQMVGEGFDAGRVVTNVVAERVEKALEPVLGPGKHVARMVFTDFYFAPGVYTKLTADPAAMKVVMDTILSVPGVGRVFRSEELREPPAAPDPIARAAALSYVPRASGDLIVVPKPYWFFVNASQENPPGAAATHGTAHSYDTRVPIMLMGPEIKPGEYLEPVTPADIAPTLAFLCGVTLARPDGRVLREALVTRTSAPSGEGRGGASPQP